jgi:hypothetical protein
MDQWEVGGDERGEAFVGEPVTLSRAYLK